MRRSRQVAKIHVHALRNVSRGVAHHVVGREDVNAVAGDGEEHAGSRVHAPFDLAFDHHDQPRRIVEGGGSRTRGPQACQEDDDCGEQTR